MILSALNLTPHFKTGLGHFYVLTGKDMVLSDDIVKQLLDTYANNHAKIPIEKMTLWLEETPDWENLYAHTQHHTMFHSPQLIKAIYQKTALDQQAKAWLTRYGTQPLVDCMVILQAPHLHLKSVQPFFQNAPEAHAIDMPALKDKHFVQFIEKRLQQAQLKYDQSIPIFISQLTQGNVLEATQCIHQLSLLVPSTQSIDMDLLAALTRDAALFPLYTFAETCIQGNIDAMLRQLQRIQQTDTEPLLLLWWLTKISRQCLRLHHALQHQENLETTLKMLGIWSTQKQAYLRACKRLSLPLLDAILMRCKTLDALLKSSPPANSWDQLEQIALSFCDPAFMLGYKI